MAADLFELTWMVDGAGYVWEKPRGGAVNIKDRRHYSLALCVVDPSTFVRRYKPMRESTGMFRSFADIVPGTDGQGIIVFANEFGPLGSPPPGFRLNAPTMNLPESPIKWDLLGIWLLAIAEMRELVSLWELIKGGHKARLGQHIEWDGQTKVYYNTWPDPILAGGDRGDRELIFSVGRNGHLLEQFMPGDIVVPAKVYLQQRVNYWLEASASPRLVWDAASSRMDLKFIPGSLLGAMWLQFARAIAGDRDFRQCKECGRWFELSPETARTNRLFCSGPCRSKAYRERQESAKKLQAKGWSLKEIATELGSDVPTVRGWVGVKKEK